MPITAANPERTRQVTHAIADGYLRFHYRFVAPYESSLISDAGAARHLQAVVAPGLDRFVSELGFEEACRSYLREAEPAADVGRWWGQVREGGVWTSRELDGVAIAADRSVLAAASCKWTNAPVDVDEDDLIVRLAGQLPKVVAGHRRYVFARGGFSDRLRERAAHDAALVLVTPDDLFAPQREV